MNWLRRLFGREPEPLPLPAAVAEVRVTYDQKLAEALELEPPREKVADLRPLSGHDEPCPRCGSFATTIDFMSGAHEHCPDKRMVPVADIFSAIFHVNYRLIALNQRIIEASIEHHDRSCHNCGFKWVEGTL